LAPQALEGLHALYEDCKLDALRWHLLRPLGRLLGRVAAALGARQYADRYQRDLALPASAFAVAAAPAGALRHAGCETAGTNIGI